VFGGDIFGVMSTQLRDALIVPPATAPVISRAHRKHSLASVENPFAKHSKDVFSENVFSPSTSRSKPLTLPAETFVTPTMPFRNTEGLSSESLAEVSENPPRQARPASTVAHGLPQSFAHALERSSATALSTIEAATSLTPKLAPAAPALVNSLNRYWQAVREARDTRHSHSQVLAETPANTVSFPVADSEQSAAPRAWPTAVERDVPQKLRSFADVNVPLKSRLASAPDHQTQNVFNTEVNHADHQSSNYDDLGDRLAQILHEQALQHGIDVT
jgi:hypothetical protein